MFYLNTVDKNTLAIFSAICTNKLLDHFFLAGGTALALQLGHRKSIDLDFFSTSSFETEEIKSVITELGEIEIINQASNTLQTFIGKVKVDFLSHQYPSIKPLITYDEFRLAAIEDIIAMKLNAINNRGAKKDFYDLYYLLKSFNIEFMLSLYESKYKNHNTMQLLKSLLYFEDAEEQPEPILINDKVNWREVKLKVTECVNKHLL